MEKYGENIHYVYSSVNLKYHGRFHLAYLMETDYVSIWDDDVIPASTFVHESIKYSPRNFNGLVGANGRTFSRIRNADTSGPVKWGDGIFQIVNEWGRVDFVGNI